MNCQTSMPLSTNKPLKQHLLPTSMINMSLKHCTTTLSSRHVLQCFTNNQYGCIFRQAKEAPFAPKHRECFNDELTDIMVASSYRQKHTQQIVVCARCRHHQYTKIYFSDAQVASIIHDRVGQPSPHAIFGEHSSLPTSSSWHALAIFNTLDSL